MESKVEALLTKLAASATSERDKGNKFERLIRRCLTILDLMTRSMTLGIRTVGIDDTLPHLLFNKHRVILAKQ
ncbi:MAG: hypothetical protein FWG16_02555 [Micrococcales bacterium]|nr:hypothetical protein [Micrococcales bacterium]